MANPRAFISFNFDNNLTEKNLFAGQAKNSRKLTILGEHYWNLITKR